MCLHLPAMPQTKTLLPLPLNTSDLTSMVFWTMHLHLLGTPQTKALLTLASGAFTTDLTSAMPPKHLPC